jgi:hypothetical protein
MFLPWNLFVGCWSYCVLFLILTIAIYFKNNDEKTAIILGSISGAFFTVGLSAYLYDNYHINKSRNSITKIDSINETNLPQTLDFEHYSDTYTYVTNVPRCDICEQYKKPITHTRKNNDGYSYPYSETVKKYYHVDCAFAYFKDKYHL